MKQSREEILRLLATHAETLKGYGVRKLGLVGSAARGEETSQSDLDFVVEFERKSFDAYMDVKAFLEQLFGCKVDLILADAIKPQLREALLQDLVHAPGL